MKDNWHSKVLIRYLLTPAAGCFRHYHGVSITVRVSGPSPATPLGQRS
jgi:hypothetical protein